MNRNRAQARTRLEDHKTMVQKLEALKQELEYTKQSYGDLGGSDYTGMPRGSSDPKRRKIEGLVKRGLDMEEQINRQQQIVNADWQELEQLAEVLKPIESLIIKLRYHYAAGWNAISMQLFGKREDYAQRRECYKDRMYKLHRHAVDVLEVEFVRKNERLQKKVSKTQ